MPVQLPCTLTQTAGGVDLYLNDNPGLPAGSSVLYEEVVGAAPTPSAPGANIDFSTGYAPYVLGTPIVPGTVYGTGFKLPAGVYLARLDASNVGEAANGFTKGCFTFTWDGLDLTAGATSNPSNDSGAAQCYIATTTNGTTGRANILTWGWRNLVGAAPTGVINVVLLAQYPIIDLF
jgi:hypothetical protein